MLRWGARVEGLAIDPATQGRRAGVSLAQAPVQAPVAEAYLETLSWVVLGQVQDAALLVHRSPHSSDQAAEAAVAQVQA